MTRSDNQAIELPVLCLGTVGFSATEQASLKQALAAPPTALHWRLGGLGEADAWCVNGSRAEWLSDGSVRIGQLPGPVPTLQIDMNETGRPMAFSLPLASAGFHPTLTFDLGSNRSIQAMLDRFEGWLRPMATQFFLASRITQDNLDLSSGVFHVSVNGRLQAVVSRRNGVGVLPIADPARMGAAVWARRPDCADEIPGHFVRIGLSQALWQYAMRSTRDLLPPRFRAGPIYWRRGPQLPQRFLNDSHLLLVRELAQRPYSFTELAQLTQRPDAKLSRDLAALYMVGAITTDKKRVPAGPVAGGQGIPVPQKRMGRLEPVFSDRTAPVPLGPYQS